MDAKDAALAMLKNFAQVKDFDFTEESITHLIEEAQHLSDKLFADKENPHDKLEYVRAHFGNLVTRTLLATWKNKLGLAKGDLLNSLRAMYTVYEANKRTTLPVVAFVKQVLPLLVSPTPEPGISMTQRFTHELDDDKLRAYLRKEFEEGMEKANDEIKEKWSGKFDDHFNSPEGQETYQMATKYIGLMAKIYYLKY